MIRPAILCRAAGLRILAPALAALLVCSGAALAQSGGLIVIPDSAMEDGGMSADLLEDYRLDMIGRTRAPEEPIASAVPRPVAPMRPVLAATHRIGEAADRLRLQGESDIVDFSLFVAAPQDGMTLEIVTQSSINVLPERSSLRIVLNDVHVGDVTLEQFAAPAPVRFDLPPGLLVPGRNRVRVEAVQYHRIFCGPEASFALWTDIDLSRSGVFPPGGGQGEPAADPEGFLSAIAADSARNLAVEIRGGADLSPEHRDWLAALTTRLSATLGGAPLNWRHAGYWTVRDGAPAASRITFLPGAVAGVRFARGGDGSLVLVVQTGPGALPEIDSLFPQPSADVVEARARGLASLPLIEPGREVALSEIGMETLRVRQHYFRRDFGFRLPEDWLVLTAEKARIRMDYAFAEGLPHNSMLLVQINGETVRLLPMWEDGGRPITRFPVDFEARMLRGGANRISFEMLIPGTPEELPCAGFTGPVLELRDSITIEVPDTPRMWMPDLARPFAYLTPDSLRQDAPGTAAFGSEELMTLRAALAQGQPEALPPTVPRLHLASLAQVGTVAFGDFAPDRRLIENVLLGAVLEGAAAGPGQVGSATRGADLSVDPFGFAPVTERREDEGWGLFEPLRRVGLDSWEWMRRVIDPRPAAQLDLWLAEQRGQAILVQLDYERPGDLWLIRGPDTDAGTIAAAIARARLSGQGPLGQVSVLGHDGAWHSWSAPDRRPVLLERVSVGNVRAVLGNYASAAPVWFALAMIALVLVAAFAALSFTIRSRGNR